MKVYLVGMPGSGKSTLGRQLAEQLAIPFVDLDAEIEKSEGKKIPDIFSLHGEAYFRRIESSLLKLWATSKKDFVMATGGGAPCHFNGMDVINNSGISVFLDVTINEILQRLQNNNDRPLLAGDVASREQRLLEIASVRLPFYRQAHIIVGKVNLEKLLEAIHFRNSGS